MTENYSFGTTSEVRTTEQSARIQAINATYFNITDVRGWPVAGLLLFQDRSGKPIRAELHLDDRTPDHVEDTAIRQSHRLLSQRYSGEEDLELQVVRTYHAGDPMRVPLMGTGLVHEEESGSPIPWMAIAAVVAALFVIVALVWAGLTFFRGTDAAPPSSSAESAPGLDQSAAGGVEGSNSSDNVVSQADAAADSASTLGGAGSTVCQSNGLPISKNARDDLVIGQRVRIQPGFQLTLRSQPGAEAGEGVGYMQNEEQATILDGPACTQGDSDSIVWWYLKLDSGPEAWGAANTSQFTLLVPAN